MSERTKGSCIDDRDRKTITKILTTVNSRTFSR